MVEWQTRYAQRVYEEVFKIRTDILEKKDDILRWIEENQSKAFICKQLHCKPETLNSYLSKMGIDYQGNQSGKGIKHDPKYIPLIDYLKTDNPKSALIKEKMFREGYKKKECELCGASIWQGKQLPLELHHKNGNHFDNTYSNLQILCPNCHSIQEGNSGANAGKYSQIG